MPEVVEEAPEEAPAEEEESQELEIKVRGLAVIGCGVRGD